MGGGGGSSRSSSSRRKHQQERARLGQTVAPTFVSAAALPLPHPAITAEDFKSFVCCKAYDIISEGRYRQFFVKCKSTSDEWALALQRSVSLVQSGVKRVVAAVETLGKVGNGGEILGACHEVMSSLSPPTRVREGVGVCCITGVRVDSRMDLGQRASSRPHLHNSSNDEPGPPGGDSPLLLPPESPAKRRKVVTTSLESGNNNNAAGPATPEVSASDEHRCFMDRLELFVMSRAASTAASHRCDSEGVEDTAEGGVVDPKVHDLEAQCPGGTSESPTAWRRKSGEFLVHPKFSHFFLMLWYVCKIEHIVRNHTRCWLSDRAADECGEDIGALCNTFSEQHELLEGMHKMFNHAVEHVTESIRWHVSSSSSVGRCV